MERKPRLRVIALRRLPTVWMRRTFRFGALVFRGRGMAVRDESSRLLRFRAWPDKGHPRRGVVPVERKGAASSRGAVKVRF